VSIERRFKMALDETRLLLLGAQILFGFQFEAVFQQSFRRLPKSSHWVDAAALLLMTVSLACLVAPSSQHRLAERGEVTGHIRRTTTTFAGLALLPFGLALGLDLYVVLAHVFGTLVGVFAGVFFTGFALLFWYVFEFGYRWLVLGYGFHVSQEDPDGPTPLEAKIEQMLTEARIALPGAQALLGFQLIVALNRTFAELPQSSKVVHAIALGCIALALVLLVAPAAFHRLAFHGADDERFFRLGSNLVSIALLPLALGICGDIYVAITRISESGAVGAASAAAALILFLGLWYAKPLLLRRA
jgi:hypothetical protein